MRTKPWCFLLLFTAVPFTGAALSQGQPKTDDKQVALITQQKQITPAAQGIFRRILGQKNQASDLEGQIEAREAEVDSIGKDQARFRENMKALKGSSEEKALLVRYTK